MGGWGGSSSCLTLASLALTHAPPPSAFTPTPTHPPTLPRAESSSRRTLVFLILTLNHIYPDYDFTLLRAHHFAKEAAAAAVEEAVDAHLVEASKVGGRGRFALALPSPRPTRRPRPDTHTPHTCRPRPDTHTPPTRRPRRRPGVGGDARVW